MWELVSDNPSHQTLGGQRKECCLSACTVEKKKKSHDVTIWTLFTRLIEVSCLILFPFGVSICEYKAAVTHKYYMVWRCKAGINEWGVCVWVSGCVCWKQRACVKQVPMGFCLDRRACWGCGLSICVSAVHNVDWSFSSSYPLGCRGVWPVS